MNNKFRVSSPRLIIVGMISGLIAEILVISMTYRNGDWWNRVFVFSLAAIILCLFTYAMTFHINVDGLTIKGISNKGRRYVFQCAEIDRIACIKKRNHGDFIVIMAKGSQIEISAHMAGFQNMAAYLDWHYVNGYIRPNVLDPKTLTILRRYARGEINSNSKAVRAKLYGNISDIRSFSSFENAVMLFRSLGCNAQNNCIFLTYINNMMPVMGIFNDLYDGYLINMTENGFGMLPLMYQNRATRGRPDTMQAILSDYYFEPYNKVNQITVSPFQQHMGGEHIDIAMDFEDRAIILSANRYEPALPYHGGTLQAFVNWNSQRN